MVEYTREFLVEVRVRRDTNKSTYDNTEGFSCVEDAIEYLEGLDE